MKCNATVSGIFDRLEAFGLMIWSEGKCYHMGIGPALCHSHRCLPHFWQAAIKQSTRPFERSLWNVHHVQSQLLQKVSDLAHSRFEFFSLRTIKRVEQFLRYRHKHHAILNFRTFYSVWRLTTSGYWSRAKIQRPIFPLISKLLNFIIQQRATNWLQSDCWWYSAGLTYSSNNDTNISTIDSLNPLQTL